MCSALDNHCLEAMGAIYLASWSQHLSEPRQHPSIFLQFRTAPCWDLYSHENFLDSVTDIPSTSRNQNKQSRSREFGQCSNHQYSLWSYQKYRPRPQYLAPFCVAL